MKINRIVLPQIILDQMLIPTWAQNDVSSKALDFNDLAGTYGYSTGFVAASYSITSDGKYAYFEFSDCCDAGRRESGTCTLRDSMFHFKATVKTLNGHDMLDQKAREAYLDINKRNGMPTEIEIKPEYDMQIVRWGARTYLIDPANLA